MSQDLLVPTVTPPVTRERPPWDLRALLYPAAFGGALAATVLGLINGYRLGVGTARQAAVGVAGAAAIALRIGLLVALRGRHYELLAAVNAGAGMLAWSAVRKVQLRAERAFLLRGGEAASLWLPGLVAALGCGLAEAVVTFLVLP
jgi:hypothetical protein